MDDTHSSDEIDALHRVLADTQCRLVLRYFHEHDSSVATIDELAAYLSGRTEIEGFEVRIQLHHSTIPKLVEHDLAEFDRRSGQLRFRPSSVLEDLCAGDQRNTCQKKR